MKALRGFPHLGGAAATSSPANAARPNNWRAMAGVHTDLSTRISRAKAALSASPRAVFAALQSRVAQIFWALADRIVWALGVATIAL